jgi:hypothetical protein
MHSDGGHTPGLIEGKSTVSSLAVRAPHPNSTKNEAHCTELLQDLLRRGMDVNWPLPCVIDGGVLHLALHDAFGD